jgi:hypothetical protein
MSQENLINLLNNPSDVGFWARIFRSRSFLQYWQGQQLISVYVTDFKEKSDNCIVFQDYVTKKTTIVKSDRPINYTLTVEK